MIDEFTLAKSQVVLIASLLLHDQWIVWRIEANKFSPRNGRKIRKEVTLSRTCHVFHVFILPDQL